MRGHVRTSKRPISPFVVKEKFLPLNSTSASMMRPSVKNVTGVRATTPLAPLKKPDELFSSKTTRLTSLACQSRRSRLARDSESRAREPLAPFQASIAPRIAISWLPSPMLSEPSAWMTSVTSSGFSQ